MAKRRLNKKFIGLLSGGALALAALVVGGLHLKNHLLVQHPEKYVAAGRDALAKQDYAAARDNLLRAAALSHPDAALDVMIGDALNGLSSKDPDNVAAARGMWEQALTVDPANTQAMERLILFWRDQVEVRVRPGERAQEAALLQNAAKKLQDADAENHLANVAYHEAILEQMLDGIQLNADIIKTAQDSLLKLEVEDPADADIPYYVARSYIWQAQEAGRSDDATGQAMFFARAEKVLSDAVGRQPANAALHYRFGHILLQIALGQTAAEESAATKDPSAPKAEISEATKDVVARAVRQVDLARAIVKPDDSQYLDINLYDARLALERPPTAPDAPMAGTGPTTLPAGDTAAQTSPTASTTGAERGPTRAEVAESIYRDVLANRPNDPATRIGLAQLLGNLRGRRDEAIALLTQPMQDDHPIPGIKGTLLPLFQAQANIHLLSLELDSIEAAKDSPKRQALIASADALCDRAYQKSPDSATVVGLKGRLELVHNRVVDATQTLKHALALTDPQDQAQQRGRYELMYNLARACEIAQQTGDAKKLASEIVADSAYPHFVPARMMLARLLITEHDFAAAKPQIDFLESILPTNPELTTDVIRMRVVTLDPVQDADKIKSYYSRLPEDTRDRRMDKAAIARVVKNDVDALRLYTLVHASSPGDADAAGNLVSWYQSHGQNQKALEVLSEARAVNPADSNLIAMQMQIQGKSPTPLGPAQGLPNPSTQVPADPLSRELAQVKIARDQGDMAAVDSHLAAAETLSPTDPGIWNSIFMRSLETSNWDRASVYMEKLAASNADHAGGLLFRVRFALAQSDILKANEIALQLTREKPEFSQSWCLLGQVQQTAGNYEDAISNFQQALDRQTQNPDAIRGIVDCAYALGNIEQAKRYIDLGRRVAPGNESFREMALSYEMTYGDPQNVIAPRIDALKAAPDDQQAWLNLAATYVAAAHARTKAQDSAGATQYSQQARATLQQAMEKFPDTPKFVAAFAKRALDDGDFPTAEQANLNFIARPSQKGRPQPAVMLSEFYDLAGKEEQAAKVLSDYLARPFQPSDHAADVGVQLHLSTLLANKLHRTDDALAALSNNSDDPEIVRQRVALLINAGRLKEAQKTLSDLAAVAPLSPELLTLKGVAQLNSNRPADARQCFDQVIAAQPKNIYALKERAQATLRDVPPNFEEAVSDLSRARDLSPQDMDVRLSIAQVDMQRNRPDDAIRELEGAIRAVPADKRVRLKLIDLYAASKPPRWSDAERLLHEVQQIPALADDVDFAHEEAHMDLARGEYVQAEKLIRAAMAKTPQNLSMVHTYYDILLRTTAFDQLLSQSGQLLADHQNSPSLWWVYPYRAQALLHTTQDKGAVQQELESGLAATESLHDLPGSSQIIQTYAALLGPDAAIKVAAARAQTDPHWNLLAASLCRQKGDPSAAIAWLETALAHYESLSPTDQNDVLRMAAMEYLAKSPPDTVKSADMYRRIIKSSPDDIDSLNNLACILIDDPKDPAFQPREALDYSERAYNTMVHAGQDEPLIKDTYGWTLIANGNNDQGLSLIKDALGKLDFPEGHYHLAEGFLKQQPPNLDAAATELTKAMQMLDQDERDGKPIDDTLKSRIMEEQKRVQSGLAG